MGSTCTHQNANVIYVNGELTKKTFYNGIMLQDKFAYLHCFQCNFNGYARHKFKIKNNEIIWEWHKE